ncbi:MAG: nuclear transport factor 2 family protein [Ginsengibacter sp.]
MKRLFLCAAVVALAFSCNNKPSSTTTASGNGNSQQEQNIANNNKVYTAIESGNTSGIDSLLANDAVDHDGPGGMEVKGKDSILHLLGDIHNHYKDLKLDVITSAANGDYVFSLIHMTGTSTDSSMGMQGMSMDQKGVDVIKFNNNNKMAEHWGFTEDNEITKMMKMQGNIPGDQSKMKK